eukprot:scaffold5502_cov115-Isochrysis_galbana.AAC.6
MGDAGCRPRHQPPSSVTWRMKVCSATSGGSGCSPFPAPFRALLAHAEALRPARSGPSAPSDCGALASAVSDAAAAASSPIRSWSRASAAGRVSAWCLWPWRPARREGSAAGKSEYESPPASDHNGSAENALALPELRATVSIEAPSTSSRGASLRPSRAVNWTAPPDSASVTTTR